MKKRTIAVLGLSVLGREAAIGLAANDELDIIALDYRKEEIDAIASHVRRAVVADIRQTEVLENEGAASWSAAVVGIRRHFDTTVLVTHFLKKKIGVRTVVVQVNSTQEEEAIRALGVDYTVFPERDAARHLIQTFTHPLVTEIADLGENIELVEVAVPAHFVGKSLRDLHLRREHQIHVVAVRQDAGDAGGAGKSAEVPPNPERPLGEKERLLLIGHPRLLERFLDTLPER